MPTLTEPRPAAPSPTDVAALSGYLRRWIDVDDATVAAFTGYVRACRYPRGAFIFRLGDPADDMVLLDRGLVRTFQEHDGREVNLRLLSAPAAALPYNSFLQHGPADEHLQAITDVLGYRVRFRAYCGAQPGPLAETMRRVLAERHFLAMQRRVHMLQAGNAAARYDYFLQHMEPEIVAGTPAYHVASYLGITPESLSRVRRARSSAS